MTRTLLTIALVAAAALAGCDQSDHTVNAADPNVRRPIRQAPRRSMPPAIVASKIYRCKDNSVVYIDWLPTTRPRTSLPSAAERRHLKRDRWRCIDRGGYSLIAFLLRTPSR